MSKNKLWKISMLLTVLFENLYVLFIVSINICLPQIFGAGPEEAHWDHRLCGWPRSGHPGERSRQGHPLWGWAKGERRGRFRRFFWGPGCFSRVQLSCVSNQLFLHFLNASLKFIGWCQNGFNGTDESCSGLHRNHQVWSYLYTTASKDKSSGYANTAAGQEVSTKNWSTETPDVCFVQWLATP